MYDKRVKTRNNEVVVIKAYKKYKIITNLLDEKMYPTSLILDIYKYRWDAETFIKLIKKNFKFENMKEKRKDSYEKLYYCQLILVYISRMITYIKLESESKNKKLSTVINKKNNTKSHCNIRVNDSNIISGLYDNLLSHVINSSLTEEIINKFADCYVKIIKNETNRSFDRIAKTPFKKWYVKGYHNIYKYTKIVESMRNDTVESLNKNLKTLTKNIKLL